MSGREHLTPQSRYLLGLVARVPEPGDLGLRQRLVIPAGAPQGPGVALHGLAGGGLYQSGVLEGGAVVLLLTGETGWCRDGTSSSEDTGSGPGASRSSDQSPVRQCSHVKGRVRPHCSVSSPTAPPDTHGAGLSLWLCPTGPTLSCRHLWFSRKLRVVTGWSRGSEPDRMSDRGHGADGGPGSSGGEEGRCQGPSRAWETGKDRKCLRVLLAAGG